MVFFPTNDALRAALPLVLLFALFPAGCSSLDPVGSEPPLLLADLEEGELALRYVDADGQERSVVGKGAWVSPGLVACLPRSASRQRAAARSRFVRFSLDLETALPAEGQFAVTAARFGSARSPVSEAGTSSARMQVADDAADTRWSGWVGERIELASARRGGGTPVAALEIAWSSLPDRTGIAGWSTCD